ncbi:MAG: hypothetical protein IAE91_02360 [Ignavibacteriaceae bacterium]|nr:hypothetical protein [Ignavibacteriaceae bacterium]
MNQFITLIFYKLLIWFRPDVRMSFKNGLKSVLSSIVYLAFAAGSFIFTVKAIGYLLNDLRIGLFLLHQFISIILFVFFLAVNAGNILVFYSTLVKSGDINFLINKPLKPEILFTVKFFENFFYSSGTLIMIVVSVYSAYCYYFEIDILTAALLFVTNFFPFMFTAGIIGGLTLIVLLNLSIKIGIKSTIVGLIALYAGSLFVYFKFVSPAKMVRSVIRFFPDVDRYFNEAIPKFLYLLPNNWISEALFFYNSGNYSLTIQYSIAQVLLSGGLFIILFFTGKHFFINSFHKSQDILDGIVSKEQKGKVFFGFENGKSIIESLKSNFLKREFHLFMREPTQIIHFTVLVVLILIFTGSLPGVTQLATKNVNLQPLIFLSVYLFGIFLLLTLSLRFVFPVPSIEGNQIWMIKSAPISTTKTMFYRSIPYALFMVLIAAFTAIFTANKFDNSLILPLMLCSVFSSIFFFSVNFGMGGIFINFKEKNPIRIASSQGATLSFLICLVYLVVLIIFLFLPLNNFFPAEGIMREFHLKQIYKSVFMLSSGSIIVSSIFYVRGIYSLEKI